MLSKLLLGTNNKGKVLEYRALLEGIPFELVTPAELGIAVDVEETGSSFEENASLKARAFAAESGLLTLADDSGLEVDALHGEPGVHSHRYAGEGATDRELVDYLLTRLKDISLQKRTARFRCVIAIATPDGKVTLCQGECRGVITFEPRGAGGFGYDPIFLFPSLNKTMAELTMEEKNRLSHRAMAAQKAQEVLMRMGSK
jgi:XTP/dITP diphosphohydrolase